MMLLVSFNRHSLDIRIYINYFYFYFNIHINEKTMNVINNMHTIIYRLMDRGNKKII